MAVEAELEQLSRFPLVGVSREFTQTQFQDIRMWPVSGYENYLIFYSLRQDVVEVIRLLHSARDLEELLT